MDPRERAGDDQLAFLAALDGRQAKLWTALPGIIQSFNAATMTVTVQPTIMGVYRKPDGTTQAVQLPLLLDVPVQFPAGGGFTLTFPVVNGDECLVVFSSRCINNWWLQGGVQAQERYRMHDLSDGFAILGFRSVPRVIGEISVLAAELRSDSRNAYVSVVGDDKVKVVAQAGTLIVGDVVILGKLTVSEEGTFNGGHTVSNHVHPGVVAGGNNTQKPTG